MKAKFFLFSIIGIIFFFFFGCTPKEKTFHLTFKLNKTDVYTPSDQIAIWLESPDKEWIKTLYISEYLAYGGFVLNSVCPDWSGRSDWKKISKDEFDAITGATPGPGEVDFEFKVQKDSIPDGEYKLFVEVHLAENYNELYSTTIDVSDKECARDFHISYIPEKYSKAKENHLADIKVICN